MPPSKTKKKIKIKNSHTTHVKYSGCCMLLSVYGICTEYWVCTVSVLNTECVRYMYCILSVYGICTEYWVCTVYVLNTECVRYMYWIHPCSTWPRWVLQWIPSSSCIPEHQFNFILDQSLNYHLNYVPKTRQSVNRSCQAVGLVY